MKTNEEKEDEKICTILLILFMVTLLIPTIFGDDSSYPRVMTDEEYEWYEERGYFNDHSSINEEDWVTATRYNPVVEQCDDNPLHTADNSEIDLKKLKQGKLKWIAVSRDLLEKYNYGDTVEVYSYDDPSINGIYIIHDTMHPRWTNRIDILTAEGEDMGKGLWEDVSIRRIENEEES